MIVTDLEFLISRILDIFIKGVSLPCPYCYTKMLQTGHFKHSILPLKSPALSRAFLRVRILAYNEAEFPEPPTCTVTPVEVPPVIIPLFPLVLNIVLFPPVFAFETTEVPTLVVLLWPTVVK